MVVSAISNPPESEIDINESVRNSFWRLALSLTIAATSRTSASAWMQVSASFHGSKYVVSIRTVDHDTLRVEVEQMSNASVWKGTFTNQCTHACLLPASDMEDADSVGSGYETV